jgi:hypothetical protein
MAAAQNVRMPTRRAALSVLTLLMNPLASRADTSSPGLASYYERHAALIDGVVYGWVGSGEPRRMRDGAKQIGVSRDAVFALLVDGTLVSWTTAPGQATTLQRGVTSFAAGASGWFAIDADAALWYAGGGAAPQRIANDVVAACIGDSADYFITRDGRLHVKGLAHRGQYGDGRLMATADFIVTASDAVAVRAHTGHAIYLHRDGGVFGTGGNRFGPLSTHGLGDKADRWGRLFDGAVAIATGSRHSLAIRADASLWAWGEGFAIQPGQIMQQVSAVAAGDTATIVRTQDGTLWQWDGGGAPRRLTLR